MTFPTSNRRNSALVQSPTAKNSPEVPSPNQKLDSNAAQAVRGLSDSAPLQHVASDSTPAAAVAERDSRSTLAVKVNAGLGAEMKRSPSGFLSGREDPNGGRRSSAVTRGMRRAVTPSRPKKENSDSDRESLNLPSRPSDPKMSPPTSPRGEPRSGEIKVGEDDRSSDSRNSKTGRLARMLGRRLTSDTQATTPKPSGVESQVAALKMRKAFSDPEFRADMKQRLIVEHSPEHMGFLTAIHELAETLKQGDEHQTLVTSRNLLTTYIDQDGATPINIEMPVVIRMFDAQWEIEKQQAGELNFVPLFFELERATDGELNILEQDQRLRNKSVRNIAEPQQKPEPRRMTITSHILKGIGVSRQSTEHVPEVWPAFLLSTEVRAECNMKLEAQQAHQTDLNLEAQREELARSRQRIVESLFDDLGDLNDPSYQASSRTEYKVPYGSLETSVASSSTDHQSQWGGRSQYLVCCQEFLDIDQVNVVAKMAKLGEILRHIDSNPGHFPVESDAFPAANLTTLRTRMGVWNAGVPPTEHQIDEMNGFVEKLQDMAM